MATVTRTHHELGKRRGATTLRQVFRFEGKRLTPARIGDILMTAPLTGVESIFGERPGREAERPSATARVLNGFSPVAGFKFDVRLERQAEGVFLVHFSQPGRRVPYLHGDIAWTIAEQHNGAQFEEEINTEHAMEVASEPLGGARPSIRRWLFFRAGHKQVMNGATNNIARLLDDEPV